MKNVNKIIAAAIFVLFFIINIVTLHDGHNWGDDFAQYIQHAINLIEHKPYASGISHDLWVVYPPGFPFILSSLIYWAGINFKALKFLNILFWAFSALAVYGIALMCLDLFWAEMITVWFLTSPYFFFFKQNVLSDIPFMCFILLSIWTFMKSEEYRSKGLDNKSLTFLFFSIFCMSYSILIRWAGISFLLAVILYFFVVKPDWKRSVGFILGAAVSFIIAFLCGSSASGYFDSTTVFLLQHWLLVGWYGFTYTFQIILNFFVFDESPFSKIITPTTFPFINGLIGLSYLGILAAFFYRLYQKKVSIMGCFIFFYLMGIVLWPVHAGMRFFLPVIVPITIYLIRSIKSHWPKVAIFILSILIFQNIFVIVSNFKFNDDDIFKRESIEMMQWVEDHIKPKENYMFSKPRALGLLTDRIGYSFAAPQNNMKYWYKRIVPLHINYLIADKRFDGFSQYNNFRLRVDNFDIYISVLWENNVYKIFKVRQLDP